LENLALSRISVGYIAAMPDVHLGKGATIGSVVASRDFVCPNAVGVDIGCGMCVVPVKGPLLRKDLPERALLSIQHGMKSSIPTGRHSHNRATHEMVKTVQQLVRKHEPTPWLRSALTNYHARQLGTLGGGNHFVELVYDEKDRVWLMLHSGSRNIGNVTAVHYDELASRKCGSPPESLAYLNVNHTDGRHYLKDMEFCQDYALENRRYMIEAFANIVKKETRRDVLWDKMVNIHHNYCECESCRYYDEAKGDWVKEKLWVTRKGATSAKKGQLGIIPGSMGTGSYIVRGRGEPESWQSCSHGAGRSLSRRAAHRSLSEREFVNHMKERGIIWDSNHASEVKDEAPLAYKDLNEVMRNQESLVDIVHHLQPLINMKGY